MRSLVVPAAPCYRLVRTFYQILAEGHPVPEIELSAGVVEYQDTGGDGPVLVFLHGLLMDGTGGGKGAADLRAAYRRVRPTLPPGGPRPPRERYPHRSQRAT